MNRLIAMLGLAPLACVSAHALVDLDLTGDEQATPLVYAKETLPKKASFGGVSGHLVNDLSGDLIVAATVKPDAWLSPTVPTILRVELEGLVIARDLAPASGTGCVGGWALAGEAGHRRAFFDCATGSVASEPVRVAFGAGALALTNAHRDGRIRITRWLTFRSALFGYPAVFRFGDTGWRTLVQAKSAIKTTIAEPQTHVAAVSTWYTKFRTATSTTEAVTLAKKIKIELVPGLKDARDGSPFSDTDATDGVDTPYNEAFKNATFTLTNSVDDVGFASYHIANGTAEKKGVCRTPGITKIPFRVAYMASSTEFAPAITLPPTFGTAVATSTPPLALEDGERLPATGGVNGELCLELRKDTRTGRQQEIPATNFNLSVEFAPPDRLTEGTAEQTAELAGFAPEGARMEEEAGTR
jgi:hypothetical protein